MPSKETSITYASAAVRRAVVLVGSQKTLPVAAALLGGMAPQLGPGAGLAVVPCVLCHLSQILIDSALVSRWLADDRAAAAAAAAKGGGGGGTGGAGPA